MQKPQKHQKPSPQNSTSWEPVEKWYHGTVGEDGHYYHKNIVIPGVLRLLDLKETDRPSLLDVACGQGVLARAVPLQVEYTGVDISPSLIKSAKNLDKNSLHKYVVADASKLILEKKDFSHAAIVLAIQNVRQPKLVFDNIARHLNSKGKLIIAMNHPCFRIPRQSSWKVDEQQKIQYRRIDRYLSPMEIPIQAHPSKGEGSASSLSFHFPLSSLSLWLSQAGFAIDLIEEWKSDKLSTGSKAKMENRSREEIPLFLAIRAFKI